MLVVPSPVWMSRPSRRSLISDLEGSIDAINLSKERFYICCRQSHMVSLSNMPLTRVENEGEEWEWDVFESTVPMSTYLVAFVVCEFHFVEQQVHTYEIVFNILYD